MAFTLRTLLVPTDFGEAAERSLAMALDLASTMGARVHVLHVYQIPVYGFPDGAFLAGPDVATRLAESAQKGLDLLLEELRQKTQVELSASLRQGAPHEEILAEAKEIGADLIVLGTHGRGLLAHALLGSVTERVVRTSTIPVLTIRHHH